MSAKISGRAGIYINPRTWTTVSFEYRPNDPNGMDIRINHVWLDGNKYNCILDLLNDDCLNEIEEACLNRILDEVEDVPQKWR